MMRSVKTAELMYGVLMVVLALAVVWVIRLPRTDVERCRAIFRGLAGGKPAVAQRIAWDRLQALDVNVGETYRGLNTEKDRAAYRREFIRSFAYGFRHVNAVATDFVNWRIAERTSEQVIVAADYRGKGKTLLMALPSSGKKLLHTIAWAEAGG